MSTMHERETARQLVHSLGEYMPSSLRLPLRAVRLGTEVPGTAGDVLAFAREALARVAPEKLSRPLSPEAEAEAHEAEWDETCYTGL